jgi:phosphocarrier protein
MAKTVEIKEPAVKKAKGIFIVANDRGLHTRPSTEIVKCASNYKSQITLLSRKNRANAKSILGILMMAASKGMKIQIEAEGIDAEDAVASLLDLASKKFHMNY